MIREVKRGKTDAADAEAICEAVTRPTMRAVPIKTAEQQAALMRHRTRDLLVRQRTMLVNALRGHVAPRGAPDMAELGIIAPQGISRVGDLIAVLMGEDAARVPALARQALGALAAELEALSKRVNEIEAAILAFRPLHGLSLVSRGRQVRLADCSCRGGDPAYPSGPCARPGDRDPPQRLPPG